MNQSRIALTVGIFVAVGLALLALLVLSFSRGSTLFDRTYHLRILLPSAAGLKPTADVMMSGVPIGKATDLQLLPDGRSVAVDVIILAKYKIRTNALVAIDALGFLGDQYLAVTPSTNLEAGYFRDGAVVQGETPFNMEAAVRSVAGLLDQAKKTVTDLDLAINNINHTVLSGPSLSNLSLTLGNLESMSTRAAQIAQDADDLIHSNTPALDAAVTNVLLFSEKLNRVADDVDRLVVTNRPGVDETIQNLRDTSASFKHVAADLEAGKGLAGGLLHDEAMKAEAASLISNANDMTAAFATFGSNLNQNGIWHMLWKHKPTEKSEKPKESTP
jgi:phospholipid/cholesterol/gamma-HCH transport system substrate-binding protein